MRKLFPGMLLAGVLVACAAEQPPIATGPVAIDKVVCRGCSSSVTYYNAELTRRAPQGAVGATTAEPPRHDPATIAAAAAAVATLGKPSEGVSVGRFGGHGSNNVGSIAGKR